MFKVTELLKATQGRLVCGDKAITAKNISIDSRSVKKGDVFVAIKGDKFDGHDFIDEVIKKGAVCIIKDSLNRSVKNPRVACIEVKNTAKALGDIARFNRKKFNIPVIAVTGSNGKTTTKEMLSIVLSKKFKVLKNEGTKNNHIGLPLTLLKLDSSYDIAVLEIGTNHFGEVKYLSSIAGANIGVITNIGSSHLEYFKDLNGVLKEKFSLIKCLKKPAIAVLNADDPFLRKEAFKEAKSPFVLGVGIKNKSDYIVSDIKIVSAKPRFRVNRRFHFALNALGYYNIYNALLAIAVGRMFGLSYRDIASSLAAFDLPRSRLNFREIKRVRFIDDTYNANPLSLKQALGVLESFRVKGRKIFVMGDMLELGKESKALHAQGIKEALKVSDILVTVGELTKSCFDKVTCAGDNIFHCNTSPEARRLLFNKLHVNPKDIILVKGSRGMRMEEVFNI